jgi:hypothetical protein
MVIIKETTIKDEKFKNRSIEVISFPNKEKYVIQVPDYLVVCDFCNKTITEDEKVYLVYLDWEEYENDIVNYAVCKDCVNKFKEKTIFLK